ncbi:hypothetical protein HXX76_010295 [Chlamydomonas incerta]|uniref:Fe2OG dioxygenase domain-containing protein n=1 Tax=Chlamydomonas incerta TaxID=51695 RepID=A0A835VZ01_CHLIN|nr:hypothetical protein HXX76_010295 [Chlamydomonas incerta]|eukprot:KAG2430196.1 hypothetical protein HXX76_010295 [Chlamydomonas incerta]
MGNQQSTLAGAVDGHRGAGGAGDRSGLDFLSELMLGSGSSPHHHQQPQPQQQHNHKGGAMAGPDPSIATTAATAAAPPSGPAGGPWSFLAPAAAAVFNGITYTSGGWGAAAASSSTPSCTSPPNAAASAAAAAAAAADKEAAALAAAALVAMPARSLAQPAFELPPPDRLAAQLKSYGVDPTADLSLTSLMWRAAAAAAAAASEEGGGSAGVGEEQGVAEAEAEEGGADWDLWSGLAADGAAAAGYGLTDVAPAGPVPVVAGLSLGPPLPTDEEASADAGWELGAPSSCGPQQQGQGQQQGPGQGAGQPPLVLGSLALVETGPGQGVGSAGSATRAEWDIPLRHCGAFTPDPAAAAAAAGGAAAAATGRAATEPCGCNVRVTSPAFSVPAGGGGTSGGGGGGGGTVLSHWRLCWSLFDHDSSRVSLYLLHTPAAAAAAPAAAPAEAAPAAAGTASEAHRHGAAATVSQPLGAGASRGAFAPTVPGAQQQQQQQSGTAAPGLGQGPGSGPEGDWWLTWRLEVAGLDDAGAPAVRVTVPGELSHLFRRGGRGWGVQALLSAAELDRLLGCAALRVTATLVHPPLPAELVLRTGAATTAATAAGAAAAAAPAGPGAGGLAGDARAERGAGGIMGGGADAEVAAAAQQQQHQRRQQQLSRLRAAHMATAAAAAAAAAAMPRPRHLRDTPKFDVMLASLSPRVLVVDGFLPPGLCDALCAVAAPRLIRSRVSTGAETPSRVSQSTFFTGDSARLAEVAAVEARVQALMERPELTAGGRPTLVKSEALQVVSYDVGGFYSEHYDNKAGGVITRAATIIIYLQDTPAGGSTHFPKSTGLPALRCLPPRRHCLAALPHMSQQLHAMRVARPGLRVYPAKGRAVVFWSRLPDGTEDLASLHSAEPVRAGSKWICTRWFKELAAAAP